MVTVLLLGSPGVGKGTASELLLKKLPAKLNYTQHAIGDRIRYEQDHNTPLGQEMKKWTDQGKLIPGAITNKVMAEEVADKKLQGNIILDGYPRSKGQAEFFDALHHIDKVISLNMSNKKELKERLTGRRICDKKKKKDCTGVFHIKFRPPKKANTCDHCGSGLKQRNDDNDKAATKRILDYEKEAGIPLRKHYSDRLVEIDVNGRSPEEVAEEMRGHIMALHKAS